MTKLKPCPFCGEEAKILKMTFGGVSYQVICGSCSANLDQRFLYEDEAIEAWNRRQNDQNPDLNEIKEQALTCSAELLKLVALIGRYAREDES